MEASQLHWLAQTLTNSDPAFFNANRKSVGIFAISNAMVDAYGIPSGYTYISDLAADENFATDFRFNIGSSTTFLNEATEHLNVAAYPEIAILARGIAPYVKITPVEEALISYGENLSQLTDTTLKVSFFCAKVFNALTSNSEWEHFFINMCKHNFMVSR